MCVFIMLSVISMCPLYLRYFWYSVDFFVSQILFFSEISSESLLADPPILYIAKETPFRWIYLIWSNSVHQCLFLQWNSGFLISLIALKLSMQKVVVRFLKIARSLIKFFIYMISFIVWLIAMYSISVVDRATVRYCIDPQAIAESPSFNIKPVVDFLVSVSPV